MSGVLGISTLQYAPWAFFNYLMPLGVLIMTALGLLTVKISDDPDTVISGGDGNEDAKVLPNGAVVTDA
jgi:NhaC family Na+:H+ antiporter